MSTAKQSHIGTGVKHYDDGVVIRGTHNDRWQKGGHDRIYPEAAKDGYVDLNEGEIVDMDETYYDSGVGEFRMDFSPEKDALELVAVPRPELKRRGREESVIATIPTEVFQ